MTFFWLVRRYRVSALKSILHIWRNDLYSVEFGSWFALGVIKSGKARQVGCCQAKPMPTRSLCLVPGVRARGLYHVWQLQAALVCKVDAEHTRQQHSLTLTAAASRQETWNRHCLPGTFVWLLLSKSPSDPDCPCLLDPRPSLPPAGQEAGWSETKARLLEQNRCV